MFRPFCKDTNKRKHRKKKRAFFFFFFVERTKWLRGSIVTIVTIATIVSFPKNLYISPTDVPFRRLQVGLRRVETAFQNSEAPLLFGCV